MSVGAGVNDIQPGDKTLSLLNFTVSVITRRQIE